MRNWVRQIHLVGIGGAGMRGIAEVLLNLGYADPAKTHPRQPRLSFDDACRVL